MEYKENITDMTTLWERHCHTKFEIICVLEGDITISAEGRKFHLSDNQIAVLPPMCFHTVSAKNPMVYRRITTLFEKEEIPEEIYPRFLHRVQANPLILHPDIPKILQQLVRCGDRPQYAPLVKSILVQIFYLSLEEETQAGVKEPNEKISAILHYIDQHITESITLEDICRETYVCKSTVCHIFGAEMKTTVKQYILQKKMAYAKSLIKTGVHPTEVASRIGYGNYSNFYRIYKKLYGVSPTGK